MSLKIILHPDYERFRAFVNDIPEDRFPVEHTYCCRRNIVRKTSVDGEPLVVKQYKVPVWLNRVVYTFFRKNKALRAYENAQMLLNEGFETALPVAYIVEHRFGLVHRSWFVSTFLPYAPLHVTAEQLPDQAARRQLGEEFMQWLLRLHAHKIRLIDSNPGNILPHHESDGWHFALVDINRLDTGRVPTLRRAMISFDELRLPLQPMAELLPIYAQGRGESDERAMLMVLQNRRARQRRHNVKWFFKRLIGKRPPQ